MASKYDKKRVKAYMNAWAHRFNTSTDLVENAVWDLDIDDSILDNPDHEIWDLALAYNLEN